MTRRQSIPERWLILSSELDRSLRLVLRRLPRGSGVLVVGDPDAAALRRLRRLAASGGLRLLTEAPRNAARVHDVKELRHALLRRTALILLSPMFKTRSHPGWKPLPRMRAASLARLAGRQMTALGGMNDQRYRKIAPLGFSGWAGISAWVEKRSGD